MRKALYILSQLRDEDIRWLARNGTQQVLEPGTTLIKADQPVKDLYFVTAGTLEVVDESEHIIAELGLGDIIGEMSFVEKRPPSFSGIRGSRSVIAFTLSSLGGSACLRCAAVVGAGAFSTGRDPSLGQ